MLLGHVVLQVREELLGCKLGGGAVAAFVQVPCVNQKISVSRSTNNAEVATVLGSIPASFDTVESEGRQMKQC
jgi:hypothetical protein